MSCTLQSHEALFDHSRLPNGGRMPGWIRASLASGAGYRQTALRLRGANLHTVCEEARCPNRGECWSRGTATFLLLGDTCTRACAFCAVRTGRPQAPDGGEAGRVADAVAAMGLRYVVLTSVTRDDLADGGAGSYVRTIGELRRRNPNLGIELLTPDFRRCQEQALASISAAAATGNAPALVWGHNLETVPRLYRKVRRGSDYRRSLGLLERAAQLPATEAKSSLMLGLGESEAEVLQVLRDLRSAGVRRIALGQYLRPTRRHLPVSGYVTPQRFSAYAEQARSMGFSWVKSGAMVRSSYHAEMEQPQ